MVEETKQGEKKPETKKAASTLLKLILGAVFLILGVWAIIAWRLDLLVVIRGCIGLFLVLAAAITFAIAKE